MKKQTKIKIGFLAIIVVFIIALLSSCDGSKPVGKITEVVNSETGESFTIKEIDGCEYIEVEDGMGQTRIYSLTHKGNCKNQIHQCH